ncbi:MAG TPA: hypothetical protein VNI77_01505 [Nitrososphaera sp.]|nr:hypothetical protein [Nitrososphaera sp.]
MSAGEVAQAESPGTKGEKTAATTSISAAAIAKFLSEVNFPMRKDELKNYGQKQMTKVEIADARDIADTLDRFHDKD